ncbi:MAG: NAD(P)H-dependent glycerol-3-phosphate dehydrogenase [Actinobacteria bacterium]|nr:MAG: NAD(P)H-dependent glycerol-3-phosphate dehydrogenase [Actinomycetota bacterium]
MARQARVAVIGAGSWGTTVASLAAANTPTVLWARRDELAAEIDQRHVSEAYLPGLELPADLRATSSIEEAVSAADVLVMAVPSHGFRAVLEQAAPHVRPRIPVVSLVKGLEQTTKLRMTQVIGQVLPGHPAGVLTGPNLAREVMTGHAAAAVIAMPDERVAMPLQDIFKAPLFRVYRSTDVIGAEIAGALKNVFAIAAGMSTGLGTGDNTRALVICRSIAEMTRLGVVMGGDQLTFAGLGGVGDLLATCISPLSRNRRVGEELANGRSLADITKDMNMVAEGVKTCGVVRELADEHEVDMPIVREVDGVINAGHTPEQAYAGLLRRVPKMEFEGVPAA